MAVAAAVEVAASFAHFKESLRDLTLHFDLAVATTEATATKTRFTVSEAPESFYPSRSSPFVRRGECQDSARKVTPSSELRVVPAP